MTNEEKQKEIKEEMALRPQPDSLTISSGSAAKGTQVILKTYFDVLEVSSKEGEPDEKAEIKVKNLLKIKQYLVDKGIMQ